MLSAGGRSMLRLYCLPGLLIAQFQFLFPGHRQNNVTATARRRESRLAHFILATPFWLIAGLLIAGAQSPKQVRPSGAVAASRITKDETPAEPITPPPQPQQASYTAMEEAPAAAPATEIPADKKPATSSAKDEAIERAFASGGPVRWSDGDQSGYAIPSSASESGCRNIDVAADGEPPSRTVERCP